ncbi:HGGxSTG domain-containing protein [Teichococcus oryzae]|uniref:HGGxSTG domain-containing protein n=1 Tax=Teichococcus oryzae TaxID=1608942 RepID=UPI00240DDD50|nr:HGGxSTG domain-containing protein [Pseudoroseomonas oryzae]
MTYPAHDPLRLAQAAPRCGARSRRTGKPCAGPAMANGRCRMHGGSSTGPRTAEGLERLREAHTVHGGRGAEARSLRRHLRALLARSAELVEEAGQGEP